jgi:hypothetical protein
MLPDYPPTFLRGIPNKTGQFFDNRGDVTGGIFRPHDHQQPNNGYYEISINWEDNDGVEDFTLRETNEAGDYRFKGGAAKVSLEGIHEIQQDPMWNGAVAYNREPINEDNYRNDYHGNLLLNQVNVSNKDSKRALLAQLRLAVVRVIPPIE